MKMKNITISDIAEKLNLSRSTIDRVLNNRGNVAPETKKKILNYIEEINYKPNRAAKHLAKGTNYNIGVSFYLPDKFAAQIKTGIDSVYDELKGYGLNLIINSASSPENQIKQVKNMKSDLDGLIIAPWKSDKFKLLINEFISDDIPVITFNRDAPESKRLFYFGCDYFKAGRVCGEITKKITVGPGKIAVISNKNDLVGEERVAGFKSIFSDNYDYEILDSFTIYDHFGISDSYTKKDVEYIKKIIKANPDLKAFYVVNQSLYLVGKVIKDMKKENKIKIIGFDLFDNFIPLIKKDVIQAVVCQEPFSQGYYPIKILFEMIAEDRKVDKLKFITRLEIIMKENLNYYNNYNYL